MHNDENDYSGLNAEQAREKCIVEWRHGQRLSKYRVERSFDSISLEDRQIIFALAGLNANDQRDPHREATKLRHFTQEGQEKIANAYKRIRDLARALPPDITKKEFYQIDNEIREETA